MELRVENLPLPLDRSLYQEAIDTYLDLSHRHIKALYTFGNVRYPGLSDLDLLVVPKDSYLAPLNVHLRNRLPSRFDPILEHDVFVLPESQLGACRYRLAPGFSLVYGRDVLSGMTPEPSVAAKLCNTLEQVHTMAGYADQLRRSGVINARSCIRVFNSQRYKIERVADLGLIEDEGYGAAIDALRASFLKNPSSECVLEMHRAFERSVTACAGALAGALGLNLGCFETIARVSHGRALVRFEGFEIADARRRAAAITAYRQELVSRNYWYGFWFFHRMFPAAAARPPWHRGAFSVLRSGSRRWRRLRAGGQAGHRPTVAP